ncbi:unnamed protein product [Linum trigynum]|uniref:Reverse transcriptase n=1 Tax=Linum trigynum TaxID=586398 RepID=A0AAV2DCU5_9ROSI
MGDACIQERLDRAFASDRWVERFPESFVNHGTDLGSDHRALIVADRECKRATKPLFRFDARWASNPEVKPFVEEIWQEHIQGSPMYRLWIRLKRLRHRLHQWSRAGTSNSARQIRTLETEIAALKTEYPIDWEQVNRLEGDLTRKWAEEELYWRQKSRIRWLKVGDQNSSYFYTVTRARRRRNFVEKLLSEEGEWVEEEEEKAGMAVNFYSSLFTSECEEEGIWEKVDALPIDRRVTDEMNTSLTAEVTPEEIRRTVFGMGSTQAPGSDGFTGKFFKSFLSIVGPSVVEAVRSFFCKWAYFV